MSELVEFCDEVAGIYFRSILLAHAGDVARQHIHDFTHATYCGSGSVELWADGELQGCYTAGHAMEVLAGVKHEFKALEDNTRLTCVHIGASAESAKEK